MKKSRQEISDGEITWTEIREQLRITRMEKQLV